MITTALAVVLFAANAPVTIALPGGPPVSMDYLAYDKATDRVWVPAGDTGRVDVVDARTGIVTEVAGFLTAKVKTRDGTEREVGPSSAAVGDGFVYVGNRADSKVCAVDSRSLERKGCAVLSSVPDGIAWVASTREVWVTTPRDGSITVLDATVGGFPKVAGRIEISHPEGYAVDAGRGLFYTNDEEGDRTYAIDVRSRKVEAIYKPGCGKDGPRGLALNAKRRHLIVACTDALKVLDVGKGGEVLGSLSVGAGVDNIDWLASRDLVYVAAGRAASLTVAEEKPSGALDARWTAPTADGARVVVVDVRGGAWVADSRRGRLLEFPSEAALDSKR